MLNNPYTGALRIGGLFALHARLGIFQGCIVSCTKSTQGEYTGVNSFFVHHLEHLRHPLATSVYRTIADHPAIAVVIFAKGQGAGSGTMDAQLVLNAGSGYIIPCTHGTILINPELGNNQAGDAGSARLGIGVLGQHEMDNIIHSVPIAGGDEALLAFYLPQARGIGGEALGRYCADFGACARFGQAHGAAPFTRVHLGQEAFLQLLGEIVLQYGGSTLGQTPKHYHRRGCTGLHFQNRSVPIKGHAALYLAVAELGTHTGFDNRIIDRLEYIRANDRFFVAANMLHPDFIGIFVGRADNITADFVVYVTDGIKVIGSIVVLVSIQRQYFVNVQPFFYLEFNVTGLI